MPSLSALQDVARIGSRWRRARAPDARHGERPTRGLADAFPWFVGGTRACVVARRVEANDTVTLVVRPHARWNPHRAGQRVAVTAEFGERRCTRILSIGSPEGASDLELTIKRRPNGVFSRWANDEARLGDMVVLGEPAGDFVLPDYLPKTVGFVAGGSGVVPIRSLVETAVARGDRSAVTVLLYARGDDETIYLERFRELASHAHVRLAIARTRGKAKDEELRGRFRVEHLDALGLGEPRTMLFACGPDALLRSVAGASAVRGIDLRIERFRPIRGPRGSRER